MTKHQPPLFYIIIWRQYISVARICNSTVKFCKNHNVKLIAIPSGFHNDGTNNLAEINGLHSQLEVWLTKFRGVSTRHLSSYLNWFNYIFTMKKRLDLKNLKIKSYKSIIINNTYIETKEIFDIPMPIDLKVAYDEYN